MKKSLLLLTLMVLLTPWALKADELTVCDGTADNSNVPFYGLYADTQGTTSECIIPADLLGDMVGGQISSMKFYIKTPAAAAWTGTHQVYVGEVDATTLTALSGPSAYTIVCTASFDATGSELLVTFDNPYTYSGGNLLIGTYVQVKGNWKSAYFYGVSALSGSGRYNSGTGSGTAVSFLPKTTFEYTPSGSGPTCVKPKQLAANNVTHDQAVISWTSEDSSFELVYSTDENFDPASESPADVVSPYTLDGLEPLTDYYVYVRTNCGSEYSDWSSKLHFKTTAQAEEVGNAWADDFEGSLGWELINGELTNAWVLGAAVSNGGTHSLYISNDGGITNAYSNGATMVYATKLLNFAEGKFEFSFDWLANGENDWDFLRVALVPASVTLAAGTSLPSGLTTTAVPAGWIALDGGSQLNLQTSWQSQSVAVNVPAGNYYLVLAWRNDGSGGSQPPAAVDNVSITKVACEYDVTGLAVANITTDAAALSWTAGEASEWQVVYGTSSSFEGAAEEIVSEASYQIGGLDPATTFYVKVRAHCDGDDFGAWSEVISFVTECEAINLDDLTNGWSENFDDLEVASAYTAPASRILPVCWKAINTTTYSTYQPFPTAYYYSSTDYSHSAPNCLKLYSYYSSYGSYDPQPQYAILPVMENLAGKQITLWARGYNATSTFKVGLISNPADASTFEQIAEQALTTAYEEFNYLIPSTATAQYVAIMIEAATSSKSTIGVYIDDISIHEAPSCEKPIELAVEGEGQTATFTWTSDAGAFEIAHATSATADPEENIAGDATENSFVMSDLALDEDHYFWVRSDCGSDGKSIWAGPVSVHIGYCVPAPSSRDSKGITGVVFGSGDDIVNNSDEDGLPNATPYYGNYSAMIGSVQAGVESTIAITTSTGNYPYGIVIWVDFNNNLSFEDDEIVYKGQCTTGSGTLNAAITVPATQALGDYRMRIGGADTYFDNFIGGSATDAHDPCYSGAYTVFHDYTLRVLEAPSCLAPTGLAVEYNGGTEATISWTSDASSFNMKVNGTPIDAAINSPSYVLGGLELATTYSVEVQANCGSATSDWTNPVSFTTDLCMPENKCEITFVLHDSYGDGWNGNAINVVDVATNEVIASMEADNHGGGSVASTDTKKLAVCDGRAIQFVWETGSYANETSYEVYDIQGQEIFSGSGAMSAPVDYTVDCPSCFKPKEFAASNIASMSAELSWTAGASETQWVLQYSEDSEFASAVSETIDDNPSFQLIGLEPEHTYYVRVKAVCGSDDESDWAVLAEPITTLAACPVPSSLAVADVLANSAKVSWAGSENQTFNILIGQDNPNNIKSYDFATGIPSDFENDATYPWVIAPYAGGACIQSSNAGVGSSTSAISVTVTYPEDGTIEFDAQCMGEGTSTAWDKCIFSIDNTEKFAKGANGGQWDHYSFEVAAGEHTFSWTYSKDGSVNATGDHFAVANIVMAGTNIEWQTAPISGLGESEYEMTGLDPETHYFVKVQGDCRGSQTEWSDVFDFFTLPTQQVVITSVGYATYYNAYAYEMPANVIGYAFADKHYVQAYVAGEIVAAQQPLVLQGEAGIYDLLPTNATPDNTPEENQLIGVLSETFVADETGYKFYVLSLNAAGEAGSAGFYWYNADGSGDFTVPAHKAYLKLSNAEANNAPGFIFDENGATSLENLKGVEGTLKFIQDGTIYILREGVIYDATGRKVRTLE